MADLRVTSLLLRSFSPIIIIYIAIVCEYMYEGNTYLFNSSLLNRNGIDAAIV